MPQLIGAVLIIALYVMAIGWFFQYVAWYVWATGSTAFALLILANYGRALADCFWRRLPSSAGETTTPPEPAFRNYFFRKAYQDYIDIVRKAADYDYEHGRMAWAWNWKALFAHPGVIFTWPIGVTALAVFAASLVVASITFVAFGVAHLLLVTLTCLIAYAVALYLRLVEWVSMAWRRVSYVCPHSECYRPIALPVYVCPSCGALHRKLLPGSYGIFRRRCACGHMLATSSLAGRRRVPAQCPHPDCSRPLSGEIGAVTNVHLPIVGGPGSGKTSYLMAGVLEIQKDGARSGRTLEFPEERDRRAFEASRELFEKGSEVLKTAELSPSSFLLKLSEPNGSGHLIYIYDAAGELYGSASDVRRRHEYLSYFDGVLFLIDPFSLPQVASDYKREISTIEGALKPSNEDPQDVYDRLTATAAELSTSRGVRAGRPIAVVLTKSDALRQMKGGFEQRGRESEEAEDEPSALAARQWLIDHGGGNLARSIESDFAEVRYYWSSALGHLPDGHTPFVPVGVLAPIQWILERRSVRVAGDAARGVAWRGEALANVLGIAVASVAFLLGGLAVGTVGMSVLPWQGVGELMKRGMADVTEGTGLGRVAQPAYRGALAAGMRVQRGPDWKWENQDGGRGSVGTVTEPDRQNQGWWWVKWDSGHHNRYRWGAGGAYDVAVVQSGSTPERLQAGIVTTTSSVKGGGDFVHSSEFAPGDQVCPYAEALDASRQGGIDLGYEFRVFTPQNVEIFVRNPRHTRRRSDPSFAAWECFRLPADATRGDYRVLITIRNHLTGQSGSFSTAFKVVPRSGQGAAEAPRLPGSKGDSTDAEQARSVEARTTTEMRFENRMTEPILVYWINYEGREVFYRELGPGESYTQPTYVTHPWRIREKGTSRLVRSVVASEAKQVVAIGETP